MIFIMSAKVSHCQGIPSHSAPLNGLMKCNICHQGHGVSSSPMLNQKFLDLCYQCHGLRSKNLKIQSLRAPSNFSQWIKTGTMESASEVETAFAKRYKHPIETERFHQFNEFLIEPKNIIRHASCLDCHNPHTSTKENPLAGVIGIDLDGQIVMNSPKASFICYKCHSEYSNKPLNQKDILELLQPSNASFHPIEAEGKNKYVPSLISNYDISSIISCEDCHNNDDPNSKGVHGSIYPFILEKNYNILNGSIENEKAYEICYKCHNRISILNDESFPYHRKHIVESKISCYSCHNSHGSIENPYLINFPENIVAPPLIKDISKSQLISPPTLMIPLDKKIIEKENDSGRDLIILKPTFIPLGIKHGECFLYCHGKNHNPAVY